MNLLHLLKYQLGTNLVEPASAYLQEDPKQLKRAIDAALPSIMGMFMSRAKTTKGTGEIMSAIKDGAYDGRILEQPSSLFSGGSATNNLLSKGQVLAQQFLSDKEFLLTKAVSKFGNIRTASASQLNRMLLPLILAVIGKQVLADKLDTTGLMNLLSTQKGHIGAAIPQGYAGLELFVNPKEARDLSQINPPNKKWLTEPTKEGDSSSSAYLLRQVWPWVMGFVVLLFLVLMLKWLMAPPNVSEVEEARAATKETPKEDKAVMVSELDKDKHPSSTADISDLFTNGHQPLDWNDIQFNNNSPSIKQHSRRQVAQLADALKQHPTTKIKVEVLAASKDMAELRAIAIKKALMDAGINKNRIDTAGKNGGDGVLIYNL